MQTLDELRQQVRHTDLSSFDQLTEGLRGDILAAVQDYQATTGEMQEARGGVATGEDLTTTETHHAEGLAGEEQKLLVAQNEALHCQSMEELRAVSPLIQ